VNQVTSLTPNKFIIVSIEMDSLAKKKGLNMLYKTLFPFLKESN